MEALGPIFSAFRESSCRIEQDTRELVAAVRQPPASRASRGSHQWASHLRSSSSSMDSQVTALHRLVHTISYDQMNCAFSDAFSQLELVIDQVEQRLSQFGYIRGDRDSLYNEAKMQVHEGDPAVLQKPIVDEIPVSTNSEDDLIVPFEGEVRPHTMVSEENDPKDSHICVTPTKDKVAAVARIRTPTLEDFGLSSYSYLPPSTNVSSSTPPRKTNHEQHQESVPFTRQNETDIHEIPSLSSITLPSAPAPSIRASVEEVQITCPLITEPHHVLASSTPTELRTEKYQASSIRRESSAFRQVSGSRMSLGGNTDTTSSPGIPMSHNDGDTSIGETLIGSVRSVSDDEYSSIPLHIRAQFSLAQLNELIDQLNELFATRQFESDCDYLSLEEIEQDIGSKAKALVLLCTDTRRLKNKRKNGMRVYQIC